MLFGFVHSVQVVYLAEIVCCSSCACSFIDNLICWYVCYVNVYMHING